jgi:hypothetical protein
LLLFFKKEGFAVFQKEKRGVMGGARQTSAGPSALGNHSVPGCRGMSPL